MSVGKPIARIEGRGKVTGEARYAADHAVEDMLHAVMVGSPVAAGRVVEIETGSALMVVGVLRVLIRADMPAFGKVKSPPAASERLPMQSDDIIYEGEPVAIVLAETLEAAEAGAAALVVRVDEARPVIPQRTTTIPSNRGAMPSQGGYWNYSPTLNLDFEKGDTAVALNLASRRVDGMFVQAARHGNPMEPSATVAHWDNDRVVIHDAVQHGPHVCETISQAFGVPVENVRVLSPHTGGAFGTKSFVWPHQLLTVAAARIMGRPVKLALTRSQMYSTVGYQPLTRSRLALGADDAGRLTAIEHDCENVTSLSDDYVEWATQAAKGLYATPTMKLSQRVERVNINLGTFIRAPIEGPGLWALESALDELAHALRIDPLDLRLANYAENDPADGRPWSSKKLREAYEDGAQLFDWRDRAALPREDGYWRIGHGMATCTTGTFRFPGSARVRLRADGQIIIETGTHDIGTGAPTVLTQIAADAAGVEADQVAIRWGDSSLPAPSPMYGSAATLGTGGAVVLAIRDAKAKLRALSAAEDFQTALREAQLDEIIGIGRFALPGGAEVNENGDETPHAMRTWGALFVEVGVDPDLGIVRLRRAVGSYSAGRIINPRTARSQMIGGIVWGWGMATMEESVQEPRYGRWLAKNLSNVAIPVNADIPSDIQIHFVDEQDDHVSPTGSRGIGELGATGVAPAVANAIYDAVGIRLRDLPILPRKLLGPRQ